MNAARLRTIMRFGVAIDISGPDALGVEVERLMPTALVKTPVVDRMSYRASGTANDLGITEHEVYRDDGSLLTRQRDVLVAAEKLADELHFEVACRASGFVFVHAGVVRIGDGALILPGRSMSGKSTLVSALLRHGAAYMSDEYAVIDDQGMVYPYARNLRIRSEDLSTRSAQPSEFTDRIVDTCVPLTHVAVLQYESGATVEVSPLGGAASALELVNNTVRARSEPAASLRASSFAGAAKSIRGIRGDADVAATWLLEWAR